MTVLWILAAMGVVTLVVVRREILRAWTTGNRLQSSAALVLVAGGVVAQSNITPSPALVRQLVAIIAIVLLLLLGTVARAHQPPVSRARIAAPIVWALILWVWLFVVNAATTFALSPETATARTVSGLLLLALLMAQLRAPVNRVHFNAALLVVVPLIMISLPFLPEPLGSCTIFKCSELGVILLGPFSSGNYLGLVFAMMAAFSLATIKSRNIMLMVLVVAVCGLYATNSRTSLFAVGAGTLIYFLVNRLYRYRADAEVKFRRFPALAGIVAVSFVSAGVYLLFSASPSSFSNRGLIWRGAILAVGEHGGTGIGLDSWSYLQERGDVSYHFAHSEYMMLYFAGGFIGLTLFAAVVASAIRSATIGQSMPGHGLIIPLVFLTLGMLEVVWNPLTVDGLTWMGVAVICAISQVDRPEVAEGLAKVIANRSVAEVVDGSTRGNVR